MVSPGVGLTNLLRQQSLAETVDEIYRGLSAGQKYISSKFFYDRAGSALFEKITTLEEYYPTRTEKAILQEASPRLMEGRENLDILELGSGDCSKISILLDAVPEQLLPETRYFPIDISESVIRSSAESLSEKYPGLQIHGVLADFMQHLEVLPGSGGCLICFFGSTIGNLTRQQAESFLNALGGLMRPGDSLLLGMDMVKDIHILEAAYNDKQGVTEEFNLNILRSVNQLAGTDFIPEKFNHISLFNREENRIEMYLEAGTDMRISSSGFPGDIHIRRGETIHTEFSHKYTPGDIDQLAEHAGFVVEEVYSDKKGWFSLVHYAK